MIDETHDPARRSWVGSANVHRDFPIQNLPFGVFSPADGAAPRGGVAISAAILDLSAAQAAGLFAGPAAEAAAAACGPTLNPLLAQGAGPRRALRRRRSGDDTDFSAGTQHATNTGRLFRPDTPLLPHY